MGAIAGGIYGGSACSRTPDAHRERPSSRIVRIIVAATSIAAAGEIASYRQPRVVRPAQPGNDAVVFHSEHIADGLCQFPLRELRALEPYDARRDELHFGYDRRVPIIDQRYAAFTHCA